jgi:hypothetical protein
MKWVAVVLIASLAVPSAALAQAPEPVRTVDPTKLGVSLDRIRRELTQAQATPTGEGTLKLDFHVQVIGQAPRIDFLEGFDVDGPMPYGGPTHREVVSFLTPQEYKGQAVPFSSLAFWAFQKLQQQSKKSRCEREIAEYRALVMQGVAVAAPRCTQ